MNLFKKTLSKKYLKAVIKYELDKIRHLIKEMNDSESWQP